jgi:hypothetical protein
MCVLYTGDLVTGSYITLPDCEATMNDVVAEVDRLLKELKDNDGVLKTTLKTNNCSSTYITNLVADSLTGKVKTSETIIALLQTICSLQTRILALENEDIFLGSLSPTLQLLVNSKKLCLDVDPCNVSGLTLEGLLTKLIYKLCPDA